MKHQDHYTDDCERFADFPGSTPVGVKTNHWIDRAADTFLTDVADVLHNTHASAHVDVALGLAAPGVLVLPTVPGDKDPLLTSRHISGTHEGEVVGPPCPLCTAANLRPAKDHGATTDPDVIRRYWSVHPDAGVGMKNHPRLVRGDGDFADAAELKRAYKAIGYAQPFGEPQPCQASTPGGQYRKRVIHSLPEGVTPPGGGTRACGVAWYGDSGYTVVKGGHPNGGTYGPFYGDITPLPDKVAIQFRYRATSGTAATVVDEADAIAFLDQHVGTARLDRLADRRHDVATAEEGTRHYVAIAALTIAFRDAIAGYYPAKLARDTICEALRIAGWEQARFDAEWNDIVRWAIAQVQHLTPEQAREAIAVGRGDRLAAVLDDAYPEAEREWFNQSIQRDLTDAELDGLEARNNGHRHAATDTATVNAERFKRWSVSDLLAANLTYQWDVRGMLVRPTYGVDTGELKTLKSYFGMARLIGLAAGVPVLGRWEVPERRRVLCYVAEGGRIPFTRRLVRMCEAHGVDVHDLDGWLETIYDAGPLDSAGFRDTLRGHLTDLAPAFVHLDPLYPFQPMTVDSRQLSQVGLMLNEIQAIVAQHDATFWVTAHMNQTGTGFDLKRITGAGVGEWGDSWCLLKHRETPDVPAGKFRLAVDVGSRQWGGATFDLDFDIGRFDADDGHHDGPLTFKVRTATSPEQAADRDTDKRLLARRGVLATMRKARTALTRTEIEDRSTGAGRVYIRAEIASLIDEDALIEHGIRKPGKGGRDAPLYVLSEGWRDA